MYFCHVSFMKMLIWCLLKSIIYPLSILKVTFLKSNPFRFKEMHGDNSDFYRSASKSDQFFLFKIVFFGISKYVISKRFTINLYFFYLA